MFGLDDAAAAAVMGSAISAGAGLLSSAGNRASNRRLADKQLAANAALWREQSMYNSPTAQVARLKQAGLSPALAYGGNGQVVGNADPAPNLDYSGVINTPLFDSNSAIQFGMSAAQMKKQLQVQDSQIAVNEANALKLKEDAISTNALRDPTVKNLLSQNALNIAKENESYKNAEVLQRQADYLLFQKDLSIQETRGVELANEYASRTMEFRVETADLVNKESMSKIQVNKALAAKYGAELDQILAETKVAVAREMNINADTDLKHNQTLEAKFNARVLEASVSRVDALTQQIRAETKYTEKQVKWFTADHISNYVSSFGAVANGAVNAAAHGAAVGLF